MIRLLLLIPALLILSCGKIESSVSPKDQAKQMLNEGRYNDAIVLLDDLKTKDKTDYELHLLLASAYAGKSSFNIVDSYAVFKPFLESTAQKSYLVQSTSSGELNASIETAESTELDDWEKKIVKLVTDFSSRFESFQKIPYIEGRERSQLVESILVLKEIPQESKYFHRARSYSSILNALQFLNYLRDAVNQPQENTNPIQLLCNIDFFTFAKNIDRSVLYLVDSVDDLRAAYKKYGKRVPSELYVLKKDSASIGEFFKQNQSASKTSEIYSNFAKHSFCN